MWYHPATSHAATTVDSADADALCVGRTRHVPLSETNTNDNHVEGDGDDGHNHIEDNVLACRCGDEARKGSNESHGVQDTRIDNDLEQGTEGTAFCSDVNEAPIDAPDTIGQEDRGEQIGGESSSIEGCDPPSSSAGEDVARCRSGIYKTVDTTDARGTNSEPSKNREENDPNILPDHVATKNDDTIPEKSLQSVDDIFHNECGLCDISEERWWTSRESVALRNQTLLNTVYVHNNVRCTEN